METLASLPTGAGSASATIPIEPSEGLQAPGAEAQDESESLNVGLNDRLEISVRNGLHNKVVRVPQAAPSNV